MNPLPKSFQESVEALVEQEDLGRTDDIRGVQNLAILCRAIGYNDKNNLGQFSQKGSYGDIIEFLRDNPGIIETIREWIVEYGGLDWKKELDGHLDIEEYDDNYEFDDDE